MVTLVALVALAWSRGRRRGRCREEREVSRSREEREVSRGREEREVSRGREDMEMTQLSEVGIRVCERGKRGEERGQQGRQELELSSLDGSETEEMKT